MNVGRNVSVARVVSTETATCAECGWTISGDTSHVVGVQHAGVFGHDVVWSSVYVKTLTLDPQPAPAVES